MVASEINFVPTSSFTVTTTDYYTPQGFAHEIFKKRYALHENESFAEACERLAIHVASSEQNGHLMQYRAEFAELLKRNLFMPGGRIWYGSGRPKGQLLNCFAHYVPVVSERGVIPISEVIIGDRVLTEDGTFHQVINTFTQGHRDTLVSIKVDRMPNVLHVTPDHKVLTKRGWVEASNLVPGKDQVAVPGYQDKEIIPEFIDVLSYLNEVSRIEIIDGRLYQLNSGTSKNKTVGKYNKQVKPIKIKVPVCDDLAKLLGYYISEGCAASDGHRVIFTYGADEKNYVQETVHLLKSLFDINATIQDHGTWFHVTANSKYFNEFIRKWIGPSFDKKMLPWWTLSASDSFKLNLLAYTCRGDGHTNVTTGSTVLTMCNPTTMMQLFFIAQSLGLAYSFKFHTPREEHHAIPVSLNIAKIAAESDNFKMFSAIIGKVSSTSDRYWRVVESVETIAYNNVVYDISVDTNHSLQIAGMVAKNCFVAPISDSREGWGDAARDMIIISGTGGGLGINFTPVRPRGSDISGHKGKATGALSPMRILNAAGDEIKGGGGRRVAMMFCLGISHGDIIEFLDAKLNLKELNNANVSVVFDDNPEVFFDKVRNDEVFYLKFGGREVGQVPARALWDRIITNALKGGEPGLLNGYLANKMNNIWYNTQLVSTNPCGEIWLAPYDCCCLGAMVLPRFVNKSGMNWDLLRDSVRTSVRFLDNVLSVNNYPLSKIKETCSNIRRIGLGVVGLHDMLLMRGLKYTSPSGLEAVDKVMSFIKNSAYEASVELAKEKGPFPMFDADKFLKSGFCKTLKPSIRQDIREHGIRNCALLTIAPTGTTSIVCDVTSGIEPMFAPAHIRRFRDGEELKQETIIHPLFKKFVDEGRSIKHFQGAYDLKLRDHFEMQRICQRHIDNACSKTINVMPGTSAEDLSEMYMEFFPELKGVTVYPEGSREDQPLTPISLDEAIAHVKEFSPMKEEATSKDSCKNGVCDL